MVLFLSSKPGSVPCLLYLQLRLHRFVNLHVVLFMLQSRYKGIMLKRVFARFKTLLAAYQNVKWTSTCFIRYCSVTANFK